MMRLTQTNCWLLTFALLCGAAPVCVLAKDVNDESALDELLPQSDVLLELKKKIETEPDNLDHYYNYAKTAETKNKPDETAWAYREMLARDPSLDRIRLDLSLVEIQRGHLREARQLLQIVSADNPPEPVQKNIATVLVHLDSIEGIGHTWDGALSTGINTDSNANVAPSSGNVTVLDTTIPLGAGAREKSDIQAFAALNLNHAYGVGEIGNNWLLRWKSGGTAYTTDQRHLDTLNVQLFGFRTGPEMIYAPLQLRTTATFAYNHLLLDEQSYLRSPRMELSAEAPLDPTFSLQYTCALEYRDFLDSDTVKTYDDRSGLATQHQIGLKYLFSARSQWEAQITFRREDAKQHYNANNQVGFGLSNTYAFSDEMIDGWLKGMFTYARASRKDSDYQTADVFIGSTVRQDHENGYQLSIGKKFGNNMTLMGGVSYTDVKSNILNYRYDNYRYTVSITKQF